MVCRAVARRRLHVLSRCSVAMVCRTVASRWLHVLPRCSVTRACCTQKPDWRKACLEHRACEYQLCDLGLVYALGAHGMMSRQHDKTTWPRFSWYPRFLSRVLGMYSTNARVTPTPRIYEIVAVIAMRVHHSSPTSSSIDVAVDTRSSECIDCNSRTPLHLLGWLDAVRVLSHAPYQPKKEAHEVQRCALQQQINPSASITVLCGGNPLLHMNCSNTHRAGRLFCHGVCTPQHS